MPKKKEAVYIISIQVTGTTVELIYEMQDVLDMLYHGDHTRNEERTVTTLRKTVTSKLKK